MDRGNEPWVRLLGIIAQTGKMAVLLIMEPWYIRKKPSDGILVRL